jgi:hypothetical protein
MDDRIAIQKRFAGAIVAFRRDGSKGILLPVVNTMGFGGLCNPQMYYDLVTGRIEVAVAHNFVTLVKPGDQCKAIVKSCQKNGWRTVNYIGCTGLYDHPYVVEQKGYAYHCTHIRPIEVK